MQLHRRRLGGRLRAQLEVQHLDAERKGHGERGQLREQSYIFSE